MFINESNSHLINRFCKDELDSISKSKKYSLNLYGAHMI